MKLFVNLLVDPAQVTVVVVKIEAPSLVYVGHRCYETDNCSATALACYLDKLSVSAAAPEPSSVS